MKKHWLLIGTLLVAAALSFGAIACGDDEDEDGGAAPTATVAEEEPTATVEEAGTPSAAEEIAPITMNEVAGSGVTGSATITETDTGGTEVVVTIDGALEYPGSHQSHIHHGNCSDPTGEIHVNLNNVEAGTDGSGTATTEDPEALDGSGPPDFSHWLAREHYVAVHALDGSVVACGDVIAAS